jgi:hypothetical protein
VNQREAVPAPASRQAGSSTSETVVLMPFQRGISPTAGGPVARVAFYRDGFGLTEIGGGFRGREGYDGVFLEVPGTKAHLVFTAGGGHGAPSPHPESLPVLYLGNAEAARAVASRLGADAIAPTNPYWAEHGTTFQDPDGFRVVLGPGSPERAARGEPSRLVVDAFGDCHGTGPAPVGWGEAVRLGVPSFPWWPCRA